MAPGGGVGRGATVRADVQTGQAPLSGPIRLSDARLLALRAAAQLLHRPRGLTVPDVVRHVCGLQAQDLGAARLGVRARARGVTTADVDRARDEGGIVRTWAMRGTLHLLAAEDLEWLLPVVVPPVLDSAGAGLARLGVASLAPRAVRIIERALASAGPLTRAELTERLARGGIEARGQAPFHLIRLACLKGVACAGPDRGKQPTFVLLRDWVSPGEALDREEGAAELARRYLAAYGPADPADLAAWAGLPLTVARDAFRRIQGELAPMGRGGGRPLMSLRAARPRPARADLVRLLPRFDTYLLGYRSREFAVPRRFAKEVHPGGGIIHPTMVRAGEVVGTWRLDRGRRAVRVASHPFHLLTRQMWRALEREAADVGRFLGLEAAIIRA